MSPVLEPGTLDFVSHSETQTRRLGARMGGLVQPGMVIALIGDLGSGKTRWAQGFGAGLGVPETDFINSPTFVFMNEYHGRLSYYHLDVYRLEDEAEAETLGLDDFFYGEGVCVVEWANRLGKTLPAERLEIEFYYVDETKRRIIIRPQGDLYRRLLQDFRATSFRK